jgi:N-acetylglucosamine malate deacetylase 2
LRKYITGLSFRKETHEALSSGEDFWPVHGNARYFFNPKSSKICILRCVPESLISAQESSSKLFGRVMVVVAHPDDESVSCGTLLQRAGAPRLIFCTDGAPRDPYFWRRFGSRDEYRELRRREALAATKIVGAKRIDFLDFPDQELFRNLDRALAELGAILQQFKPDTLLTHAYEGGHPDHDACAFLVSLLAAKFEVPAWEMALYHRAAGDRALQQFIADEGAKGEVVEVDPNPEEVSRKRAMIEAYASQGDIITHFGVGKEVFRQQLAYDFTRPPHPGTLNYEEWRWSMTGREVSAAFAAVLQQTDRQFTPAHDESQMRAR